MFVRSKRTGGCIYRSVVCTYRDKGRVRHAHVTGLGRLDSVDAALVDARRTLYIAESNHRYWYGPWNSWRETPHTWSGRLIYRWGEKTRAASLAKIEKHAERVELLEFIQKAMNPPARVAQ
jgi:hypothetical protein